MKQLSIRALLLGIILSMVLAAANVYLGLYAGITVSASIPAAVISLAIFRLLKNGTILENNIVQTAASAGEAIAAGAIFTLPALILMGHWIDFSTPTVMLICAVGGILGVLCTIPLRHALIDEAKLPFPEGVATAAVLEAGHGKASQGIKALLIGGGLGAIYKLATSGFALFNPVIQGTAQAGKAVFYGGANLSPALLAVGYIVGLNVALLVFAGGIITWMIGLPLYGMLVEAPQGDTLSWAFGIWSNKLRYLGVGSMLVGGLWALWKMRSALTHGLRQVTQAAGIGNQDLPRAVTLSIGLSLAIIMFMYYGSQVGTAAAIPLTVVMILCAGLFSAVAAYMAGVVGSSNNPVSGMTIATILLTSVGLLTFIGPIPLGPVTAILVGAVVCCAAAIGGDSMQDLKAGTLLGAMPAKQQIAQMVGVLSATLILAPVMSLLLNAYGFGVPTEAHPNPLPAPQAGLMAAVAEGVFSGKLPWLYVGIGAAIGIAIIVLDEYLTATDAAWRAPVLAVAVGIYLPMKYSAPIAMGGLLAYWVKQKAPAEGQGLLAAAGLITGEALMGIAIAVPIFIAGSTDVLHLGWTAGAWLSLLCFGGIVFFLQWYKHANR